ncbi:MAG: hypothetical protein MR598_08105 [Erysipelotrichaceae bacterium]|nr:hypothetical protein [Erysipelotrichaceae bacterium]
MEIKNLKKISISNLILIILNDKNNDILRKCAEVELRKRIKNVGWEFDDLLHFDDKVIQKRGLDVNNYLISPNINMQQLMETYFMYDWQTNYDSNYLLFSEKHLCNDVDFGDTFFTKVCTREIRNLNRRLENSTSESQKKVLLSIKQILEERNKSLKKSKQEILKDDPIELLCHNEAMYQLDGDVGTCHEFLQNCSDEEIYKLLSSRLGLLKTGILETLNDTLYDPDLVQNLCGLNFVRKDSSKLSPQKKQLLLQLRNGSEVNYETEQIQKVLQRAKK